VQRNGQNPLLAGPVGESRAQIALVLDSQGNQEMVAEATELRAGRKPRASPVAIQAAECPAEPSAEPGRLPAPIATRSAASAGRQGGYPETMIPEAVHLPRKGRGWGAAFVRTTPCPPYMRNRRAITTAALD
jgi:hypothetical protein